MSRRTAKLLTNLQPGDSPSQKYADLAAQLPRETPVCFGPGVYQELRQELHSIEAIGLWAIGVARRVDRPVLINVPDQNGESTTLTISPPGWTKERLNGYLAGFRKELEAEYGPIGHIG